MSTTQVFYIAFRWSVKGFDIKQKDKLDKLCKLLCSNYVFQLENTENNYHYQGYMHLNTKKRAKPLAISCNEEFPGIEMQPASNNGKFQLKKYCMKEDTRVEGPWADKPIYMGSDLWSYDRMPEYQKHLLDVISQDPGDRKIMWIYDPVGNNGKTKFAKYITFKGIGIGLGYGDAKDILNLVSKFQGKRAYVFDLTRCKPKTANMEDTYSAMEVIKAGFFINTKYETDIVTMNPPHVIIMSNSLPNREHLSKDRWEVLYLRNNKLRKWIYGNP